MSVMSDEQIYEEIVAIVSGNQVAQIGRAHV